MKNDKKPAQKFSEYLIILLVLAGMFGYFKFKWKSKKDDTPPITQSIQETTEIESTVSSSEIADSSQPAPINDQQPGNPTTPTTTKKPDPLLIQVATFSNSINEGHEKKLREMFTSENKEEFMEKYLELKIERSKRLHDLLKTDNSRAAMVKLNYEFHNKFYDIIGKDLYSKYLKVLKETNDDAKKTRIVLEF